MSIVRVNEKNVIINGFHLFLLVTVARDSAVCQSGISLWFIYCSCFISLLFFCPYIAYDRILKKFDLEDLLFQRKNSFHCVSQCPLISVDKQPWSSAGNGSLHKRNHCSKGLGPDTYIVFLQSV